MDELLCTFLQPSSAAWSVYADELQARGDPRGELIAIELSLESGAPEAEREQLEARQVEHLALECLRISGHDVVIELADAALPRLRELDLALVCGWGDDRGARSGVEPDWLTALFNGPATQRLRSLDLSRNNPGAREYTSFLGGREPGVLFEALARTSVCGRLEQLSLPSPTDERIFAASEQLGRVARLRMPRLYSWCSVGRTRLLARLPELEIESEYPHRPSGVIDPLERIEADSSLVFHRVSAQHFADLLEHRHEQLSPTARATLVEFWERFSRLALAGAGEQPGSARELVFDLPRFRQALDELIHDMAEDPGDFELLRGMLYEHSERGLELAFQRVLE